MHPLQFIKSLDWKQVVVAIIVAALLAAGGLIARHVTIGLKNTAGAPGSSRTLTPTVTPAISTPTPSANPSTPSVRKKTCTSLRAVAAAEGRALRKLKSTVSEKDGRIISIAPNYGVAYSAANAAVAAADSALGDYRDAGGVFPLGSKFEDDLGVLPEELEALNGKLAAHHFDDAYDGWNQLDDFSSDAETVGRQTCPAA